MGESKGDHDMEDLAVRAAELMLLREKTLDEEDDSSKKGPAVASVPAEGSEYWSWTGC